MSQALSTKDAIFQKAVELFATKGYHGTSIRELASAVGIKESSIYNHFPGKSAILQAILDFQMEAFHRVAAGLEDLEEETADITDPVEFWFAGARAFLASMPDMAEPISRIIINEMFLNPQCRDFCLNTMFAAQKWLTENVLTLMRDKGMIKDCHIQETAANYVYMLQGLEIENKLRIQDGEMPETVQQNLFVHIRHFIEKLK